MRIPFRLKFICVSMLTALLLSSLGAARFVYRVQPVPHDFLGPLTLTVFGLGFAVGSVFLSRILREFLKLQPGRFKVDQGGPQSTAWVALGFLNLINIGIVHIGLVPRGLLGPLYRALGARIGKNVVIGGIIIEPLMIEIGDDVNLGYRCCVAGHVAMGQEVRLDKVTIKRGATIGGYSVIMPGVSVGEGAVIAAGSVVLKGTRIGVREVWGGNPARKIRGGGVRKKAS